MKKILLTFVALLTASVALAQSVPAFNALLTMGKEQRFVLVGDGGETSSWLKLGDEFNGYLIKSYDPATGLLELERNGKSVKVALVSGAGVSGAAAASAEGTRASLADAQQILEQMRFQDMMAKTIEQQKKAMAPMLQNSFNRLKVPEEERAHFQAMQQKVLDEVMSSMTGPEMQENVAKVFADTYTKEELQAMGAFYATPAGQSMIAKQPQVQEKMMQAMMPKMMQVGPRMQQLAKEYAAERAARAAASGEQSAAPATPAAPPAAPAAPAKQ